MADPCRAPHRLGGRREWAALCPRLAALALTRNDPAWGHTHQILCRPRHPPTPCGAASADRFRSLGFSRRTTAGAATSPNCNEEPGSEPDAGRACLTSASRWLLDAPGSRFCRRLNSTRHSLESRKRPIATKTLDPSGHPRRCPSARDLTPTRRVYRECARRHSRPTRRRPRRGTLQQGQSP